MCGCVYKLPIQGPYIVNKTPAHHTMDMLHVHQNWAGPQTASISESHQTVACYQYHVTNDINIASSTVRSRLCGELQQMSTVGKNYKCVCVCVFVGVCVGVCVSVSVFMFV